jgi:hypothetical protein
VLAFGRQLEEEVRDASAINGGVLRVDVAAGGDGADGNERHGV